MDGCAQKDNQRHDEMNLFLSEKVWKWWCFCGCTSCLMSQKHVGSDSFKSLHGVTSKGAKTKYHSWYKNFLS
jgi:hypothetical protein